MQILQLNTAIYASMFWAEFAAYQSSFSNEIDHFLVLTRHVYVTTVRS
jgi:hypothetical protein